MHRYLPKTERRPGGVTSGLRERRVAIAKDNEDAKGKKRISTDASAYSFRHARMSELLQINGVDPLTVAARTGTSVAMFEKEG